MERIYSRTAYLTAIGIGAVNSQRDLPTGLFDGVTRTYKEAQEMAFKVNMERRRARNIAKARRGLAGVMGA